MFDIVSFTDQQNYLIKKETETIRSEPFRNPWPTGSFKEFRKDMFKVSDKLYKQLISPGTGEVIDSQRHTVTYQYACFVERKADPIDCRCNAVMSIEEDIEPMLGQFLALTTMKENEHSLFWIASDYMYGDYGL